MIERRHPKRTFNKESPIFPSFKGQGQEEALEKERHIFSLSLPLGLGLVLESGKKSPKKRPSKRKSHNSLVFPLCLREHGGGKAFKKSLSKRQAHQGTASHGRLQPGKWRICADAKSWDPLSKELGAH